jgi:enterochelin esterase-like enzyme
MDVTPKSLESTSGTRWVLENFPSRFVDPRNVEIWLPPGFIADGSMRYQVIYLHDGQNQFDPTTSYSGIDWGCDEAMVKLMSEGKVPPTILVGVWNTKYRFQEYMPEQALRGLDRLAAQVIAALNPRQRICSEAYLRFLVSELKPWVDSRYPTHADAVHTSSMGSSMGGLISLYATCRYPDVFGGAGCLSMPWQVMHGATLKWLPKNMPSVGDHRLYFDYGTHGQDAEYEPYQSQADAILRQASYQPGVHFYSRRYNGDDHHERYWRLRVHIPIQYLLTGRIDDPAGDPVPVI